jgi:phosphoenolpyruvate---glycerone phosphotransferase subunit DhaL
LSEQRKLLLGLLEAVSHKLIAAEKTLTELDSAIGDGDCGASIKKGFESVVEKLPSLEEQSMGTILKQVGLTISSNIGGVSGAIYATGFMRAGKSIGDKEQVTLQDIHEALQAALVGIKERGEGTQVGDKTMVDALEPAINAFGDAASEGSDVSVILEKALAAARKGSDSTISLQAKKGRASYLGERSIGHRDAGSMVICLMFEAAYDFYREL